MYIPSPDLILSNLSRHVGNEKICAKYRWLAHYHNACCQSYEPPRGALELFGTIRLDEFPPSMDTLPTKALCFSVMTGKTS